MSPTTKKDPGPGEGPERDSGVLESFQQGASGSGWGGLQGFDVTLQLGSGDVYCTSFGGTVTSDRAATGGRKGLFIARNAPPGGCPAG